MARRIATEAPARVADPEDAARELRWLAIMCMATDPEVPESAALRRRAGELAGRLPPAEALAAMWEFVDELVARMRRFRDDWGLV